MKKRNTITITVVILVSISAISLTRYFDFPALHRGIPQTLKYSIEDMDLTLGNPRYYCLSSFIDSEWLWKAYLPAQDMNLLAEELKMHPIPSDQIGNQFFNMPPYWWQPENSDQIHVLATTKFPINNRGPDGWHALATWNPDDGVLHMWIKDNF